MLYLMNLMFHNILIIFKHLYGWLIIEFPTMLEI